jgi:hypothetical protein
VIGKGSEIDEAAAAAPTITPWRIDPCGVEKIILLRFFLFWICKDPPPIKKQNGHKDHGANAAKRRPNPTRNVKKLTHILSLPYSLISRPD